MIASTRRAGPLAGGWGALVLLAVITGCAKPWRPPTDAVRRENLPPVFYLRDYAPDQPGWQWVYERSHNNGATGRYVRRFADQVYATGALVGKAFQPLSAYLQPTDEQVPEAASTEQPGDTKPPKRERAPLRGELAAIIVFDPPLPPLPLYIRGDEPVTVTARLTCHDEWGRHLYDGDVRRTVLLEGLEDIRAGETDYADCLRLRITTRLRLYWGPTMDLVQYIWLARRIGEVRRVERVTAWVLFLPYSATERFSLVKYERPEGSPTPPRQPHTGFRRWASLAIELAEALPSPRIGGMRIELTDRGEFLGAADDPRRQLGIAGQRAADSSAGGSIEAKHHGR